jgi:hypothetical protein
MTFSSSSGNHFDSFLADGSDSRSWSRERHFVEIVEGGLAVKANNDPMFVEVGVDLAEVVGGSL